jgi:hypothetical protein
MRCQAHGEASAMPHECRDVRWAKILASHAQANAACAGIGDAGLVIEETNLQFRIRK